ncbi:MAG: T9SS type A sorting domain-containing protein [Dysgonamonadaceae bacterium]|jgi:hypothetical protein|nr:T9SS type A sorting domain-containing protein [Dysgonamonadaceae bacterium]
MKKNSLKYVWALFLCAILNSPMAFATQYCHTAMSSIDGTATIYLSCQSAAANQYEIKIESDVAMNGLGGSFANVNGVDGYQLNVQGRFQLSADKLTITIPITSTTPPRLYTPLYVLMPVEKVFTWPSNVDWGVCESSVPDDVAPVMGTATVMGDPSYFSAILTLTATDDVTDPVTRFVANDPDNGITNRLLTADEAGNATINGLSPSTTYNLTIYARDDAGNTSANSASVSFTTTARESDCEGDKGHFAIPTATRIHYTIQYSGGDVIYTITPINTAQTITFAEVQTTSGNYPMTIAANSKSATYTQTELASGATIGVRFLYSLNGMPGNEMTSENITLTDPNIIYYVVGQCGATAIAELSKQQSIKLYPNPVTDNLNILSDKKISQVIIRNLTGQTVKAVTLNNFEKSIDLKEVATGNYFVTVLFSDGQLVTKKALKK